MWARFCIVAWIFLLFSVFPQAIWASSKPALIFQKAFGVHPSILQYSEYQCRGKIVGVILLDMGLFNFAVAYANPPKSVSQFHNDNRSALLTLNGGYWDNEYLPTDLCIVEGKVIQRVNVLNSHFGLFAVRRNGQVVIDDLKTRPLSKADVGNFLFAIKSGPHLVREGKPVVLKSSTSHARTIVGKNNQNKVLFAVTRSGTMTYSEMAEFLIDSELGVDEAFNLDGGASTGFVLGRGKDQIQMDSVKIANVIQLTMKNSQ